MARLIEESLVSRFAIQYNFGLLYQSPAWSEEKKFTFGICKPSTSTKLGFPPGIPMTAPSIAFNVACRIFILSIVATSTTSLHIAIFQFTSSPAKPPDLDHTANCTTARKRNGNKIWLLHWKRLLARQKGLNTIHMPQFKVLPFQTLILLFHTVDWSDYVVIWTLTR